MLSSDEVNRKVTPVFFFLSDYRLILVLTDMLILIYTMGNIDLKITEEKYSTLIGMFPITFLP